MTVVVPNAIALAGIADGSSIVASDHRNNYSAVQVGVNGLIAMFTAAPTKGDLIVSAGGGSFDKLGVGANGTVVTADSTQPLGVKWAAPVAAPVLAYAEFSGVVTSTATTFATGTTVVSAGALTFDGATKIRLEVYFPLFHCASSAVYGNLSLADGGPGGTDMGFLARSPVVNGYTVFAVREFTPPAGTKTYSAVLWVSAAGTTQAQAGAGGAGTMMPGYIKIVKA